MITLYAATLAASCVHTLSGPTESESEISVYKTVGFLLSYVETEDDDFQCACQNSLDLGQLHREETFRPIGMETVSRALILTWKWFAWLKNGENTFIREKGQVFGPGL